MRNKNRIPIVLNLMLNKEILFHFLDTSSQRIINRIYNNWENIEKEWLENPDLRLGQLLFNRDFILDHPYNIEEDDWLIKNNYIQFEEIKFWGINYDKNGNKLPKTEYKLLKDLDDEHIQNIINFFKKYNALNQLPKDYLEYFNKRINNLNK
jgi:hypothetical protein